MNQGFSIQVLLTFILYLTFFGWIGYRRGDRREFIVLLTAVIGWLVLQEQGDIFVRVANLGGKFTAFIASGGLSENPDQAFAAIGDAPSWVTETSRSGFLFLIWVLVVILAYVLTGALIPSGRSPSNGWAILWGIFNGLFYASVFLPRLVFLFAPTLAPGVVPVAPGTVDGSERGNIITFLRTGFNLIWELISRFWMLVEPIRPWVFLLLLTAFLLFAFFTIRTPKVSGLFRTRSD